MKKFLFVFWMFSVPLRAFEGITFNGQIGEGLPLSNPSNYSGGIAFGGQIGLLTNYRLEMMLDFLTSTHSGTVATVTQYSGTISADVHLLRNNDFELTGGIGPGLYIFRSGTLSETDFGIHFGGWGDAWVDEKIRVGLGIRYHNIFTSAIGTSYWCVLARLGFVVGL